MAEILQLIKEYGLETVLLVFYIYLNQKDKARLEKRFDSLEEFCRGELTKMAKESTQVIADNAKVIERSTEIIETFINNKIGGKEK